MLKQSLVLICCLLLPVALGAPSEAEESHEQEEDKRGEYSRILRGGPTSFSRILRGGPTSFSRILRGNEDDVEAAFARFAKSPSSLSRILRGGPSTFSRILKSGGPSTFSRILKSGGPSTFSRILRAYYREQQQQQQNPSDVQAMTAEEAAKRQSFSRILRSSLSRIYKKSAEEPEWHFQSGEADGSSSMAADDEEEMDRVARDPGFSRILRDPHFSRILRAQEFSRIL